MHTPSKKSPISPSQPETLIKVFTFPTNQKTILTNYHLNTLEFKFHKLNGSKKTPSQDQSKSKSEDTSSVIIKETTTEDTSSVPTLIENNIETKENEIETTTHIQDPPTIITISDASSINESETRASVSNKIETTNVSFN